MALAAEPMPDLVGRSRECSRQGGRRSLIPLTSEEDLGDRSRECSRGSILPGRSRATTLEQAATAMMKERDGSSAAKYEEEDKAFLLELLADRGHGSALRGWRLEMDPEGELKVSFQDFVQAAARLRFFGDTLALFSSGMSSDPNTLTLECLLPREAAILDSFRHWVKDTFTSPMRLFAALDAAGLGEVTCGVFRKGCQEHGCELVDEDLDLIWDCCDVAGEGVALYEDFIFLELDPEARSSQLYKLKLGKMMQWRQQSAQEYLSFLQSREQAKKERASFHLAHRRAPRLWLDRYFEQMPTVKCQAKAFRVHELCRRARLAKIAFQDHAKRTYVTDVRAWRRMISPINFEITPQAVRTYCATHGLNILVKELWDALDQDKDGVVRFEEYSLQQALPLAYFLKWAREKFGSCAAIWETPEAAAASRKLTGTWFAEKHMQVSTFKATLKSLGWPGLSEPETRKSVFNALDLKGFGMINQSDLAWLDGWHPPEWVTAQPDEAEWNKLKALLTRTYGHLLKAWRSLLDRDDSNALSWAEFKDACRRLKFDGNVGACWRWLDVDMSGMISMKEYDVESFEILSSFKEWAEANFGSIGHCFKHLDEDHSGSVSFKELKHACRKLHWKGDVRLLFDCLDVNRVRDSGVRAITVGEICFLDNWQLEPSEEELAALDEPPPPKITSTNVAKEVKAINDRLASPLNLSKLGLPDWRSASIKSIPPGWSPELSSSVGMLPKVVSPYAKPLWPRGTKLTRSMKRASLTSTSLDAAMRGPTDPAELLSQAGDDAGAEGGYDDGVGGGASGGGGFGLVDDLPRRPMMEGRSASMSALDSLRSTPLQRAGSRTALERPGSSPAGY
mmetsp:Transcript_81895/g.213230  ORF Transcript_81895/g.213230 Transcript_81895/m.213230 type:complete len:850 (+) Transcript_81895:61-2610(+)